MTTGNPAFCLFLYLNGVHFRSKLQHTGDVSEQKIKCSIRSQDIGGVGGRGGGGGGGGGGGCQIVKQTIC